MAVTEIFPLLHGSHDKRDRKTVLVGTKKEFSFGSIVACTELTGK